MNSFFKISTVIIILTSVLIASCDNKEKKSRKKFGARISNETNNINLYKDDAPVECSNKICSKNGIFGWYAYYESGKDNEVIFEYEYGIADKVIKKHTETLQGVGKKPKLDDVIAYSKFLGCTLEEFPEGSGNCVNTDIKKIKATKIKKDDLTSIYSVPYLLNQLPNNLVALNESDMVIPASICPELCEHPEFKHKCYMGKNTKADKNLVAELVNLLNLKRNIDSETLITALGGTGNDVAHWQSQCGDIEIAFDKSKSNYNRTSEQKCNLTIPIEFNDKRTEAKINFSKSLSFNFLQEGNKTEIINNSPKSINVQLDKNTVFDVDGAAYINEILHISANQKCYLIK